MKKIRTIAMGAMYGMLVAFSAVVLPSCNGGADGEVKFASTKIPLPLGRYVQLSRPYATYSFTEPDGNGDGEMTVDFDFEVMRHVPRLEYMMFKVEPVKWIDGEKNFRVKFKKDQQAVEQLSNAIKDEKTDRATIRFNSKYDDLTVKELDEIKKQWNGKEVQFDNSAIYIEVPLSRIHLSGINSEYVTVTQPSSIQLYSDNNSSIYIEFWVEVTSTLQEAQQIACTIKTEDGDFEAMLISSSIMNSMCYFGTTENNRYYISPRDMDKLLSSPIDIYIDMK